MKDSIENSNDSIKRFKCSIESFTPEAVRAWSEHIELHCVVCDEVFKESSDLLSNYCSTVPMGRVESWLMHTTYPVPGWKQLTLGTRWL